MSNALERKNVEHGRWRGEVWLRRDKRAEYQRRDTAARCLQHAWRLLQGKRALRDRAWTMNARWWRHWRLRHRERRAANVIQRGWRAWRASRRRSKGSPALVSTKVAVTSPHSVMADLQLEQGIRGMHKRQEDPQWAVRRCLAPAMTGAATGDGAVAQAHQSVVEEAEAYLRSRLGGANWRQQVEHNLQAARLRSRLMPELSKTEWEERPMSRQLELFVYPKQSRYRSHAGVQGHARGEAQRR